MAVITALIADGWAVFRRVCTNTPVLLVATRGESVRFIEVRTGRVYVASNTVHFKGGPVSPLTTDLAVVTDGQVHFFAT